MGFVAFSSHIFSSSSRKGDICGHKHYRRAADSEPESKTADHQGE
jgi:hypothetical protein